VARRTSERASEEAPDCSFRCLCSSSRYAVAIVGRGFSGSACCQVAAFPTPQLPNPVVDRLLCNGWQEFHSRGNLFSMCRAVDRRSILSHKRLLPWNLRRFSGRFLASSWFDCIGWAWNLHPTSTVRRREDRSRFPLRWSVGYLSPVRMYRIARSERARPSGSSDNALRFPIETNPFLHGCVLL
jgi:hypothetical protein